VTQKYADNMLVFISQHIYKHLQ